MIAEDQQRRHQRTVGFENTKLVRRLPVISEAYLNPVAIHFKTLQEEEIKAMAQPKYNPWYARLHKEYIGKILYDRGCFRVISIQYVPNKQRKERFPMLGSNNRARLEERSRRIRCSA
jgi:hypothetical protein